ncbi:hypothetical protein TR75_05245 [Hydrogenibacillus schlegelii]|uniref:alpha/beta fold hydrolase n=1 Tax=Hydrogenibacillus schlegelii TaxID=1484 RepID=UPI0007913C67|nr:alpha/beta fold hydrolase [Hydrogenibacillus schlegelii]KWX06652.1 hypothetical protein TR75_05245 [Hydrogenibacillus schlegelii]
MNAVARSPSPFFWTGGPIGLLILHGFAGTPSEMRPMGAFFHRLGYTVHAPLLPGHGETPEALRRTRWTDWVDGARAATLRLAEAAPGGVVVAGLSMGGAIALLLARELAPRAAVVLAAPLRFRDRRAYLAPLVHRFSPYRPREGKKPPHIEAHLVPYDRIPLRSVAELWRLLNRKSTVAGLSMGGAIALLLARELAPRAAVVLAAPLRFRDRRAYLAPLVHRFSPYRPREGKKPPHIEAHLVPYDRIPLRSVAELWRLLRVVRRELPDVRVPLFIAQGLRDETIFPHDAERIYRRAGTPPAKKALVWYPEASHLIVLEREKEALFRDIARFLHTHVPGAPAPPESGGAPV